MDHVLQLGKNCFMIHVSQKKQLQVSSILADLTVSKRPGTSCQIEIHSAVANHLYL